MLGAIVIAGSTGQVSEASFSRSVRRDTEQLSLASISILGCSTVVRTIEYLKRNGMNEVSVFGGRSSSRSGANQMSASNCEEEAWHSASRQLKRFREEGFDAVLITRTGAYVESDFTSLVEQHRRHGEAITRAFDRNGPLDMWVVDPRNIDDREGLSAILRASIGAECEVEGYVNRLQKLQDLRQLAADFLSSRCKMRPQGTEIRPGVWIHEGAQFARGARIVAPAYIGKGAKIADECLITRCSNVESNSHVDFGTAVEDSSILSNTYVGIGLDIAHSVVDGDEILNLHHDVRLRISDPVVLRRSPHRGQQYDSPLESEVSEIA